MLPESSKPDFVFEDGYKKVYTEVTPADDEEKVPDESELGKTYKKLNWMKAGFLAADKNVTVSPSKQIS